MPKHFRYLQVTYYYCRWQGDIPCSNLFVSWSCVRVWGKYEQIHPDDFPYDFNVLVEFQGDQNTLVISLRVFNLGSFSQVCVISRCLSIFIGFHLGCSASLWITKLQLMSHCDLRCHLYMMQSDPFMPPFLVAKDGMINPFYFSPIIMVQWKKAGPEGNYYWRILETSHFYWIMIMGGRANM